MKHCADVRVSNVRVNNEGECGAVGVRCCRGAVLSRVKVPRWWRMRVRMRVRKRMRVRVRVKMTVRVRMRVMVRARV